MTQTARNVAEWLGYLTVRELDAIKTLARLLPPRPLVVNIGAGAGTVTLGILEERDDALIFSIDVKTNEDEINTNEHLRLAEAGYSETGQVIRVWGDSKIVGKRWRWPADLIVVDGDHTQAGLQGDIDAWLHHVRPGGIIAYHDYTRKHWPDVQPTVDAAMTGAQQLLWVDTLIAYRVGEAHQEPYGCGYCAGHAIPSQ
jgi:predicted O-methyltransferase YrrM